MSQVSPSLNPFQAPVTRDVSPADTRVTSLNITESLPFEGKIPTEVLAQIEFRRYRDQMSLFGGFSIGAGGWGLWYFSQYPHHPLAYGAILLSLVLGAVFVAWPLIYVHRLRRHLRDSTETMKGRMDSDGVRLTDGETTESDRVEQSTIPWSSLSLALLNKHNAVLFRRLPDDRTQLLIFTHTMFKSSADWQLFRQQLRSAYQQAPRLGPTIARQILSGIRMAIIYIAVFAIAIAVALSLRNR